jgi:hypothetical protein
MTKVQLRDALAKHGFTHRESTEGGHSVAVFAPAGKHFGLQVHQGDPFIPQDRLVYEADVDQSAASNRDSVMESFECEPDEFQLFDCLPGCSCKKKVA